MSSAFRVAALVVVTLAFAAHAGARPSSTSEDERPSSPSIAQVDDEDAPDSVAPDEDTPLVATDPASNDASSAHSSTTIAPETHADVPIGDPPPPVGDVPPRPVDEIVDDGTGDDGAVGDRSLPPPDARTDTDAPVTRRELRQREKPGAVDIVLGGAAGSLGGMVGGGLAMLASTFMGVMGFAGLLVIGSSTVAAGGLSPLLFYLGGSLGILGFTLAGILFVLSPAIAAVVAGVAMLLFAVDAAEGDWWMLASCAAGIAAAIIALVFVLLTASVGVVLDPCSSPWMFTEQAGPDGSSLTPRPALTSTMIGAAVGGIVGSLVIGGAAFAMLPVSGIVLRQLGVDEFTAGMSAVVGVVIGFPAGLVIGSAIGGGVGGAIGVALEE